MCIRCKFDLLGVFSPILSCSKNFASAVSLGTITEDASVWILQFVYDRVFFCWTSVAYGCSWFVWALLFLGQLPSIHPLRHFHMLRRRSLNEIKLYKFSSFEGVCRMFSFKWLVFGVFCFQRALVLSRLRWTYCWALIWLCDWTDLRRTGSVVQCIFLLPLPWSAISTLLITYLVFFKLHSSTTH